MSYRFAICDVFTRKRFGGNPLAVLPDAGGLTSEDMQRIAREFNFSETTFVLPPERGGTRAVRIFTPTQEIPFAGHPNVGTAFVLFEFGELEADGEVVFEEGAGDVPIRIERDEAGEVFAEVTAPTALTLGSTVERSLAAAVVSLPEDAVVVERHLPREASVGLPFLMIEAVDRAALAKARIDLAALDMLRASGANTDVHLYTRSGDEFDIRSRMFAPDDGVPEDPATGSANVALSAFLASLEPESDGDYRWRIAQGVEMGRPSELVCRVNKRGGEVAAAHVGGHAVWVASGELTVD